MYDPVWICKDGRQMHLHQMTEDHLINCIARIERMRNWRREWLPRLELELAVRQMGMSTTGPSNA